MLKVASQLRERFGLEVTDKNAASQVYIQRGEIAFEISIPHNCLEWFVTAKDKTSDKEIWSDWMEHYDGPVSALESERSEAITRFVERLLKSDVRMVYARWFFRRRLVPEWNSDGRWERLALVWV